MKTQNTNLLSLADEYQKLKLKKIKKENLKLQGIKVDNVTLDNLRNLKDKFNCDMKKIIQILVQVYDHIYFVKYIKPLLKKDECPFLIKKRHSFQKTKRFNPYSNSNLIWVSEETHFKLKVMKFYFKIPIISLMRKIVDNYLLFLEKQILNTIPYPDKEY